MKDIFEILKQEILFPLNVKGNIVSGIVKSYLSNHAPFFVTVMVTHRCNLSCRICPYKGNDFPMNRNFQAYCSSNMHDEIDASSWFRVIDNLKKNGIRLVVFTGGEPLLKEDVFQIASYARDSGLFTILSTNGTLIDDSNARLVSSNFDSTTISFYGMDETHDFHTSEGAFEKASKAALSLSKTGHSAGAAYILTNRNIKEFEKFSVHGREKGISYIRFHPVHYDKELIPSREEYQEFYNRFMLLKKQNPSFFVDHAFFIESFQKRLCEHVCPSLKMQISVSPDGRLLSCCTYPVELGNLLTQDLGEALKNADPDLSECEGCCLNTQQYFDLINNPLVIFQHYLKEEFRTEP